LSPLRETAVAIRRKFGQIQAMELPKLVFTSSQGKSVLACGKEHSEDLITFLKNSDIEITSTEEIEYGIRGFMQNGTDIKAIEDLGLDGPNIVIRSNTEASKVMDAFSGWIRAFIKKK
jgi:hypothetical protein